MPQLSVGAVEPDYPGDQWHYVLMRILTTARAYGLQAIDGPYAAIRDVEGFRRSHAVRMCSASTESGLFTPIR